MSAAVTPPVPPASPGTTVPPAARAWLPFYLANAVVWGSSFGLVRAGLTALGSAQVAFGRMAIGAVTLALVALATRTRLPRRREIWKHIVIYGALQNALPLSLFAFGQQFVPSVLASIINAATPLSTLAFIIVFFPEERPTPRRVLGLITGFLGILVVLGVWQSFPAAQWYGALACLGGIVCYGLALPYARRHIVGAPEGPVAITTAQIGSAAVLLLPVMLLTGATPHGDLTWGVVLSMVALGALGTGMAFVWMNRVIAAVGSATASTVTYLTPIVAAVIGVLVFDERLSWNEPIGAVVVVAGIVIAQGLPRFRVTRRRPSTLPTPPPTGTSSTATPPSS